MCLLFDKNFGVISEVTHREQLLSSKHEAVEIYAVGCGVHRSLTNSQNIKRDVGPILTGIYNGVQCGFSLITLYYKTTGYTYRYPLVS